MNANAIGGFAHTPDVNYPKEGTDDMLRSIFVMQAQLNDYVFVKNGIRDNSGGSITMQSIADAVIAGKLSVNEVPNQWISRYTKALEEELIELKEELLWKWWSKDSIDIQNIRVELVDILHFLVSAMISAGLTPEKLHDIYRQKHAANLARQDTDYNRKTKTEDDNRRII